MHSMLDQDFYSLTVGQAILECFPEAYATFEFKDRNGNKFNNDFLKSFEAAVATMPSLKLMPDEKEFLESHAPFLKPHYFEYLKNYRYDPNELNTSIKDGGLKIHISGLWHRTIYWEIPLLFSVCESYYQTMDKKWGNHDQQEIIQAKSDELLRNQISFADFGSRRRRNYESQDRVVSVLKNNPYFVGTSNVHFAHKYGVKPIGTMSHQWIMAHSALESLRYANRYALRNWNKVYQGDLGIALPDTYGSEAFFEDFDKQLSRLFDGVRHDSNDPFQFANRVVDHYKRLRIDHSTKTIVFSDRLDVELAVRLSKYCRNLGVKCSFGIGTNFTNSYANSAPLNIVIKLRSIRKHRDSQEIQVVKLSDVMEKATGDKDAIKVAQWTFFNQPLNS